MNADLRSCEATTLRGTRCTRRGLGRREAAILDDRLTAVTF